MNSIIQSAQNIKIEIEYDGSNFFGWEIQPEKRTIRGEIEKLLKNTLNEDIKLVGASRTDTGVHALAQIANFNLITPSPISKIKGILLKLPRDIYVKNVSQVPLEFNIRKNAKSKVYFYRILLGRSPLLQKRVWEYKFKLDIKRVEEVLPLFLGMHRFDLFSYRDEGECEIKQLELMKLKNKSNEVIFKIEGNRFLHKMVRMIIGTLTEVGRGKIGIKDIKLALELKGKKFLCAPPQGLYLKEVKY